jgi:hypothetical protein
MFLATACLRDKLPSGTRRHDLTTLQMCINGSIIDLTGAGSPRQLAGNRCNKVIQDEVDGYESKGDTHEHPSIAADQRTRDVPLPKRVKASTPTLDTGMIWTVTLQGDLRRRFIPCPHCGRHHPKSRAFTIAWSEQYTVLPIKFPNGKTIPVAQIKWDKEARRPDGSWDLDRVIASARAECPHCGGHVRDEHKVWCDAHGFWLATKAGAPGRRSYHLPAMFSSADETRLGQMARQFLLDKESPTGMKAFINNFLAEPHVTQEFARSRIELISPERISAGDWLKLMTVDVQQNWPYFWFVVRAWKDGHSESVEAGHADTWADLGDLQKKHAIKNATIMVDAGFGAREDAEVYRNCFGQAANFAFRNPVTKKFFRQKFPGCETFGLDGWLPCKGFPSRKRWKDESGVVLPWRMQVNDPFKGTSAAGSYKDYIFEYAADYFLDLLDNLRKGRGKFKWAVAKDMTLTPDTFKFDEYWRHLDGRYKDRETDEWKNRGRHWPDHLLDCEKMQVALASYLGLFAYDSPAAPANAELSDSRPL